MKVLMKNYPSKSASEILEKLSNTLRLFFLLDFLDESTDNDYAILQVLHPIFFNLNKHVNFHHLMQRFHTDNPQLLESVLSSFSSGVWFYSVVDQGSSLKSLPSCSSI